MQSACNYKESVAMHYKFCASSALKSSGGVPPTSRVPLSFFAMEDAMESKLDVLREISRAEWSIRGNLRLTIRVLSIKAPPIQNY